VAQDEVFKVFAENTEKLRQLVLSTIGSLDEQGQCRCARAHEGLELPFELPG
jgi:5'-methylthioadenosine phosphorylase